MSCGFLRIWCCFSDMENPGTDDANLEENDENMEMENAEQEDLELGLSLEGWSPTRLTTGPSTSTDCALRDRYFPWEFSVGSPQFLERHASQEGVGLSSQDVERIHSEKGEFHALDRGDRDRDSQHKRAKVLIDYDAFHISAASSSGADSSNPVASGLHNDTEGSLVQSENAMFLGFSPTSDDDSCRRTWDSVDEGNDGCDASAEDVEVRMDLTEDLLHMVFSFLSHKDLCKAGATCKQWQVASAHEDFWRILNFEDMNITPGNFSTICHRYPNAVQVNILGVLNAELLVLEAMTSLRKLECLTLGKGQLPDGFFHALTDCPSLRSLHITDASLGSGIQEISVHHEGLQDLQFIKCRVLRISVRCPQLQTLSLKRTSMAHVLFNCPQLNVLDISACHKLSDAVIRTAAASCPLLTSLDMSFCSCVSDETLREIAFACPNLHVLDASYCPNISLESVRLPMLTDLKLQSCEGIISASMASISHSYMLEALQLDCCGLLTSVSLDLPHLQNISFVHCRKFVDLNLRSPVLSAIKVSNCPALHRINITSNALQKLVLQKQESLATLSLECHSLQEVDLTDCESLTNTICEVFSDGGGCPMLRSLILDNCESLNLVGLNSSSLASLSLVGCRAMTALELSCPNLQKVNLDGCDHLERASFCPVGLWSLNLGICPKLSILQIEAPNMLLLELQGCGVLSQASINCPRLLSLDASFCRQLKDDSLCTTAAACPFIKSLILSSCLFIGSDALSSLHWLRNLTLLDLSYTFLTNLQPVFETCSRLETLKLIACKSLCDSSLDALYKEGALPALRELDLSYSTIGKSAIEEILASCTNLVNVNLNACANMHDIIWVSSGGYKSSSSDLTPIENDNEFKRPARLLENLKCVGCPNIRKVFIPTSARCYNLSQLNVSLATNLKEVHLSCLNLNDLNLSNCSSLEILKLDCPRLCSLHLQACSMVTEEAMEAAISSCYMLETLNVKDCLKIQAMNLRKLRMLCPSLKRIHSSLWS